MKPAIQLACFAILLFASCKQKDQRIIDKERKVTGLPAGDAKFLALKDTAQKYIGEFINSLEENGSNDNYEFNIKSNYSDNGINEHMWAKPFLYKNNVFSCVFIDSAFEVKNVITGDTVFINKNDVEDWVIYNFSDSTKMGYFSEKYLSGKD